MKKIILILILAMPIASYAQNCNPFVSQALITNSPLMDVQNNGQGILSFNVGNSGTDPMPLTTGNEMIVVISLSNGLPLDTVSPINSLGGTFKNAFSWTYNASSKSYTGVQSTNIPGSQNGGVGTLTIAYRVTVNSIQSNPQNGFNVNVTPPPYLVGINGTGDDFVSSFTWTSSAAPLPIRLTNFAAHQQGCTVQLAWTATEMSNFNYFVIERSFENKFSFNEVATINPNTNSNEYSYLDTKVEKGVDYYYRLKMVDQNGTFTYSKIVNEKVDCGKEITYSVIPNPATTTFRLNDLTDVKEVKIYDAYGKVVATKSYKDLFQNPNITVQNFSAGMYMVSILNKNNEAQGLKLFVE